MSRRTPKVFAGLNSEDKLASVGVINSLSVQISKVGKVKPRIWVALLAKTHGSKRRLLVFPEAGRLTENIPEQNLHKFGHASTVKSRFGNPAKF